MEVWLSSGRVVLQLTGAVQRAVGGARVEPVITIRQGERVTVRARFEDEDGTPLSSGDVTGITLTVFDPTSATPEVPVERVSLDVSQVFFGTLQTSGWAVDSTGYNFKYELAFSNDYFTEGTKRYRCLVRVTAGTSPPDYRHAVFHVQTLPVWEE